MFDNLRTLFRLTTAAQTGDLSPEPRVIEVTLPGETVEDARRVGEEYVTDFAKQGIAASVDYRHQVAPDRHRVDIVVKGQIGSEVDPRDSTDLEGSDSGE